MEEIKFRIDHFAKCSDLPQMTYDDCLLRHSDALSATGTFRKRRSNFRKLRWSDMSSVNENGVKYIEMAPRIRVHESIVAMWLAQGIFLFAIIVTRKGWEIFEYIDVYRTRIGPCCTKDFFSCINIDL